MTHVLYIRTKHLHRGDNGQIYDLNAHNGVKDALQKAGFRVQYIELDPSITPARYDQLRAAGIRNPHALQYQYELDPTVLTAVRLADVVFLESSEQKKVGQALEAAGGKPVYHYEVGSHHRKIKSALGNPQNLHYVNGDTFSEVGEAIAEIQNSRQNER